MTIEKPLILIVEDQKINREILKGILSSDYRVVEAVNGKDALKALSKRRNRRHFA
jgi:CheY-like chemotaxis protein